MRFEDAFDLGSSGLGQHDRSDDQRRAAGLERGGVRARAEALVGSAVGVRRHGRLTGKPVSQADGLGPVGTLVGPEGRNVARRRLASGNGPSNTPTNEGPP